MDVQPALLVKRRNVTFCRYKALRLYGKTAMQAKAERSAQQRKQQHARLGFALEPARASEAQRSDTEQRVHGTVGERERRCERHEPGVAAQLDCAQRPKQQEQREQLGAQADDPQIERQRTEQQQHGQPCPRSSSAHPAQDRTLRARARRNLPARALG